MTGSDGTYVVHVQSGAPAASTGEVTVADNPLRGIYAIAESNEMFNTSGIHSDGADVTSPIHVHAVRAHAPDEDVTSEATCVSEFDAIVKITGNCVATLDQTTTSPGSEVDVTATFEDTETSLPFRVWQPIYPVSVKVDDNFLERIAGVLDEDCLEERFQETAIHVDVSFRHSNSGPEVVTGRLDHLVTFSAGDSGGLVSVEGNVARGLAAGQASVSVLGPFGEIGSAAVIVSDNTTAVSGIDVVVPTDIVFAPFSPEPPFQLKDTALAQATLVQSFDFEGKEGPILAYARFEDNRRMPLTPEMGLSVTSLAPDALAVEHDPLRAITLNSGSGDMIDARWTVCGAEAASGIGHVEMDLPAPIDAQITLSADALARAPDDAAALAGLPICTTVDVTLIYETGETKDFTLDDRTFYDDLSGDPANLFELQPVEAADGTISGIQVCSVAGVGVGAFALIVSFTHAPELGQFVVPINIVEAQGLSLTTRPWPTYGGSAAVTKTNFSQLENTGQYQQGALEAILQLSDATTVEVSTNPATSYALSPSDGVFSVTSPNILTTTGPGAAQATATFGDQTSAPLDVTASATGVLASSLALGFPATFKGIANSKTAVIDVTATFEDGTVLGSAQEVPGLLTYESSYPDAMTIDTTGTAALHANHRELVLVTVTATTGGATNTFETACNLEPAIGDVDLGQAFGIAHPDVLPGEDFVMPVRVNTGNQAIGALDLTFEYDPTVITAVSGEGGGGWPGGQLEITLNDPPGQVHIVAAASAGTTATGNALEVARVNFQ
ncbi:MAG: cohesin domain-containing protein, partial [Myxococcota bacterium]|nr:cohesin domain-containing protein [Myxococcota bacterium]